MEEIARHHHVGLQTRDDADGGVILLRNACRGVVLIPRQRLLTAAALRNLESTRTDSVEVESSCEKMNPESAPGGMGGRAISDPVTIIPRLWTRRVGV